MSLIRLEGCGGCYWDFTTGSSCDVWDPYSNTLSNVQNSTY